MFHQHCAESLQVMRCKHITWEACSRSCCPAVWAIKYSRLSDSPSELETLNVAMLFPAAQIGCGCAAVQERRHGFSLHSRSDLNISMRATFILSNTKIADWV